jgi:hypothetical protein
VLPIRSRFRAFIFGAGVLAGAFAIGVVITFFNPARPRLEYSVLNVTSLGSRPGGCERVHEFLCGGESDLSPGSSPRVLSDLEAEKQVQALQADLREKSPGASPKLLETQLVSAIYTPARRGRVLAAFHRVKKSISEYIASQPLSVFSKREKQHLLRAIDRVSLELPPPANLYADEPGLFARSEVFYERGPGNRVKLRIGGAFLLAVESRFNLIFTLAHELAHAIDPCEIRSAKLSIPAYDRLAACFMRKGLVDMRPTRRECGRNDQLSETFADWLASQITAEALAEHAISKGPGEEPLNIAIIDSVRDLCEDPEADAVPDTEHHPPPKVRIERIFGEHPTIQSLLGCHESKDYCHF